MINERYLEFLATQECAKMLLANSDMEGLKKGVVEFNERNYDLIKIGSRMDELVSEILAEYEVNVDENTEKSE